MAKNNKISTSKSGSRTRLIIVLAVVAVGGTIATIASHANPVPQKVKIGDSIPGTYGGFRLTCVEPGKSLTFHGVKYKCVTRPSAPTGGGGGGGSG
jgi:hypothetical protein